MIYTLVLYQDAKGQRGKVGLIDLYMKNDYKQMGLNLQLSSAYLLVTLQAENG